MTLFFEDPELLRAYRRGDQHARRAVYVHYDLPVWCALKGFRACAALSEHDRRDIHSETFLRAFAPAAACGYDGKRSYSAYITTIARNCARDWLRQLHRRAYVAFDERSHFVNDASADEDLRFDEQRAASATRRWLEQQPADVRTYVELRFICGTSQRDMAQAAGISRRTARTLDADVLCTLKAHLDTQGIAWKCLFK